MTRADQAISLMIERDKLKATIERVRANRGIETTNGPPDIFARVAYEARVQRGVDTQGLIQKMSAGNASTASRKHTLATYCASRATLQRRQMPLMQRSAQRNAS